MKPAVPGGCMWMNRPVGSFSRAATGRRRACSVLALLAFVTPATAQERTPTAEPRAVGLDPAVLAALDADLASGKYGLVDSMLVLRCGEPAYQRTYPHDYGKIY